MKKLIIPAMLSVMAQTVFAGPADQMGSYEASNITPRTMNRVWRNMETEFKGKDCYRRAHIWSYEMYRDLNVKSKKIFLHYTDKWNHELDKMGGEFYGRFGTGKLKQLAFDVDGISKRDLRMVRHNITWDYHVAPVVTVDGEDYVLDKELDIAYDANPADYSDDEAWRLEKRPASPEEWVEGLTIRGEILWKARKAFLKEELHDVNKKARKTKSDRKKKKYHQEARAIEAKMVELGMDKHRIDIKCKKVSSIAEVDQDNGKSWCFYSEAPMYYYNEIDLRNLAYGDTRYSRRYQQVPPMSIQNETNYEAGERKYTQTRFNKEEIEDAQAERKTKD